MLDRKFLRENRDLVTRAVALKRESVDIAAYYDKDAERRAALQETETLQAEANRANKAISERKKAGEDAAAAIAAMKDVAERIKLLKARAAELEAEVEALYLRVPNVPPRVLPRRGRGEQPPRAHLGRALAARFHGHAPLGPGRRAGHPAPGAQPPACPAAASPCSAATARGWSAP